MADESTNIQNQNEEAKGGAPAEQQQTPSSTTQNLRTFTQEQLDAIIARERSKAVKGLFTAEQMQAKDDSISALTSERDIANANLAKLQAEVDSYKNEKFLTTKGVPADMVEFYAFKIGKLVNDKTTFEQAAEQYFKDNPPAGTVRVSTGGGVNGNSGGQPKSPNEKMNALIRSAR